MRSPGSPGRPALRQLAFALRRDFPGFLAILAANRKRQRPQPALRNLVAALETVPVGPLVMTRERLFDLVQRLGLHLDEGQLDIVLDIGFGRLGGIQHALAFARRAHRPHVADFLLHFAQDLPPTLLENPLQLGIAIPGHVGLPLRRTRFWPHDETPFSRFQEHVMATG
jgi:hypothetical protein